MHPLAHTTSQTNISPATLAKIGGCWSPSFSPDGSQIAFISNLNGLPQIWIVPSSGGWPQLVTALDDPVTGVLWQPTGEWLAFSMAPGGGMNGQIYLIRPDGTDMQRLTPGGREGSSLTFWTHDGQQLAVAGNLEQPDTIDSYLVELPDGRFRLVARNPGIGGLTDLSRDGARALIYRMENRSNSNLFVRDLAAGTEHMLTPHEGPGNFEDARFTPDSKTIYLISDQQSDQTVLGRVELDASGQPGPIIPVATREDAGVEAFEISPDGRHAAIVWNVAGRSELSFLDLTTHQQQVGPTLPAEVIFELRFSPDSRLVVFMATGSTRPRDIWVYDLEQNTLTQLTHSPHPGIQLDNLAAPELVSFTAHDGLALTGWLYRPRDFAAPGPCVLSFHGGPEGQERPAMNSTYQALVQAGIAVFAPNVRGSGGFGKNFVNLDNGPLRFGAIEDIRACATAMLDAGVADRERLGIMGGSYGGYMTLAGITSFPKLFRAAVNLFGMVNFKTFFAHTEPWMASISKVKYGDPDTQSDLLDQLSPLFKLDQVQTPTLVLHGANDTNVPVVEAEQVVENLTRREIAVDYILFPDEGHGFVKEANRIRAANAIVDWFSRYLQADP